MHIFYSLSLYIYIYQIRSDQISCSVVSKSLRPHESQHARPPCPSPTPRVHSDSRPSNQRCHPAISSSVVPFSSCPQSLPASESFPMTQAHEHGANADPPQAETIRRNTGLFGNKRTKGFFFSDDLRNRESDRPDGDDTGLHPGLTGEGRPSPGNIACKAEVAIDVIREKPEM